MLPVVRFVKHGAANGLTALLLGSIALFGCSLKGASKGATLSLVVPNPGGHALVSHSSGPRIGVAPAAWNDSGFKCYGVNVVGQGIPDSSPNPKPPMSDFSELIAGTKSCAYRGVVSNVFTFPSGGEDVTVNVQVPPGAGRIVQLIGITNQDYCNEGFLSPVSGSSPGAYEIGHAVADLFGDATVEIPITYSATESKRVDCGSGAPATITASVTFTSPAAASYLYLANQGSVSLTGYCSELGEPVIIGLNSGAFTTVNCDTGNVWTVPNGTLFTSLSDGVLNFTADHSGPNGVAAQVALTLTKDTVTPVGATALTWGQVTPFNSLNVSASWTRSLAGDLSSQSIQFYSDGTCTAAYGSAVALSSVAATQSFTAPADGDYSYKVTSFETAGNSAPSSCSPVMTIDTVAPTLAISTPAANSYINSANVASYAVAGTCSENTRNVVITGDASATVVCTAGAWSANLNFSAAASGTVTINVNHSDAAGNAATQASRSFIKDVSSPTVAITSPAASSYVNISNVAAFSVSGTCTENGQPVTVSGNASATPTCTAGAWSASLNFTAAAQGTVTIYVNHSDAAGNPATQASRSFIKDTIAPTVAVTSPNGAEVWMHGDSPTITWTDSEPGNLITLEYSVDAGFTWVGTAIATSIANSNSYIWTFPAIATTQARIRVTSVDVAGNSSSDATDADYTIVGLPTQFAFGPISPSAPTFMNRDSCYGPLMVQTLDVNGQPSNVNSGEVVALAGNTLVDFYPAGDPACIGAPTTNVSISAATYQSPVYYRAISSGTQNITASGSFTTGQRSVTSSTIGVWANSATAGPGTARTGHSSVWNPTHNQMQIWGGFDGTSYLNTGGFTDGTAGWTAMTGASLTGRKFHSVVVDSSGRMIVWGGTDGTPKSDGGILIGGPFSDFWTPTTVTGAPTGRYDHSAVYAPSLGEMIIWGGNYGAPTNTGARLNTASNTSWVPVTVTGAPSARYHHVAVWDPGTAKMIIWGGYDGTSFFGGGARYDPTGNSWTPITMTGAPSARKNAAFVMAGSKLFIWGGDGVSQELGDGALYDPSLDSWSPVSMIGAPRIRGKVSAAWNGSRVFVWGGNRAGDGNLLFGGLYDPAADTWESTTMTGAPSTGAQLPSIVWSPTATSFLVFGGLGNTFSDIFRFSYP